MRAIVRLMTVPAPIRDLAWLEESLTAAIQLELSTIPPYLYAAWSIDPATDSSDCGSMIASIAQEEMLHLGIACNLLTAIGGTVDLVSVAPTYPTQLPTHIHAGLNVDLTSFSQDLLLKTFMAIEEPTVDVVDDPDFTPSGTVLIGQFYDELLATLTAIAPPLKSTNQVNLGDFFGGPALIVEDLAGATAAINLIKRQGEGSATVPFEDPDHPGELAHFYQFGEFAHGHRLTRTAPFSYTGDELHIPQGRALSPAPPDTPAAQAFDQAYSDIVQGLQAAWRGDPDAAQGPVFTGMPGLTGLAETLITSGAGPAFRLLPTGPTPPPGQPVPTSTTPDQTLGSDQGNSGEPPQPPTGTPTSPRLADIKKVLDTAVDGATFGAHGPFWRGLSRDEFVAYAVFGRPLLEVGHGADSNLVRALRGQNPFGSDTGTTGATFRRMPAGRPPLTAADIDLIEQWIDRGCPDTVAADPPATSRTTGAFRPEPSVHVDYFRDLDDWSMFHATPEITTAINSVFTLFDPWRALARDPQQEAAWHQAATAPAIQPALNALAVRQQQTLEAHYDSPVPLLNVLDGFERFGADKLPVDPLRPAAPHHTMNGPMMWFIHSAFAQACAESGIAADFWLFMQRAILCGLLNDGVFRGRFTVDGFAATDQGRLDIFTAAQIVSDTELPAEIRARYVASGL